MAEPTLIFDGDCGFCTSSAAWIQRRLPTTVRVVPWQSLDLAAFGLTVDDVTSAAYFVTADGGMHRGHLSIGQALRHTGGPYRIAGRLIMTPPISYLASVVYDLVAKYRYRLPGSTDACRLPSSPVDQPK